MDNKQTLEAGKALLEELNRLRAEHGALNDNYRLLADEMVYEGNSVSWWHSKAVSYRSDLEMVWSALKEIGIRPDGRTHAADAIRLFAQRRPETAQKPPRNNRQQPKPT